MKKFLLFALCAIASISAFAEAFSMAKYKELENAKDYIKLGKYCYEAQLSKQSCYLQMNIFSSYFIKTNEKATIQVLLKQLSKFQNLKDYKLGLCYAYANMALSDETINRCEQLKIYDPIQRLVVKLIEKKQFEKAIEIGKKYNFHERLFKIYKLQKNYNECWKTAKEALTKIGGFNNPEMCVQMITYVFRYKPQSVTKEQQIKFLSKLAQIYPIPGTDFNKWKSFMGFIGFKYKVLTGKELF